MHSRRLFNVAATALALGHAPVRAQPAGDGRTLQLVTALYPPFNNPPGHPRGEGIDVDVAREALKRGGAGGYRIELQQLPWKRALLMLEHGLADFATTTARTPERDRFLDWSVPYRLHILYRFYSRKGSSVRVRRLEDVARYRLGLGAAFFYPEAILAQAGANVEKAKDLATAVKMLQSGRVELLVISNYAGVWEIREQGLAADLQAQPFEYSSENHAHMAFSRARPQPGVLAAMSAGLTSMLKDGSIARIEQRYLR